MQASAFAPLPSPVEQKQKELAWNMEYGLDLQTVQWFCDMSYVSNPFHFPDPSRSSLSQCAAQSSRWADREERARVYSQCGFISVLIMQACHR